MDNWVLQFPIVESSDWVLLKVSRKVGGEQLDLDLIATDGESAYRAKVREKKIDRLKDEHYTGSCEQWKAELLSALVPQASNSLAAEDRNILRTTCRILARGSKSSLAITLSTDVSGIKHTHGTIKLDYTEDTEDVNLFEWTSQAITDRDSLRDQTTEHQKCLQTAEQKVKSLQTQLQDLIRAKEEHERQLLSKFTLLLNEKKLRIRVQQRQLAEQEATGTTVARTDASHSSRKRKATTAQGLQEPDSESDAFEPMDTDAQERQSSEEQSVQARRSESEAETESDDDVPLGSPPRTNKIPGERFDIPPPRDLPFELRAKETATAAPTNPDRKNSDDQEADDETASEDDEL
ncbi:hypothetical protein LTR64_003829 [Lithohypha guttulata]|uniref:uncharacterized protein n=1 Tax=Lithohypha guttulata TaxID=1690604 RepID=UPI002DE0A77B|nr:hypothetical protein LTR51_006867 [Lithohypha guttulata]